MFIPRFRGRAIKTGKAWSWELFISIGPEVEENVPLCMASKETFISREAALLDLQDHIPGVMRETCKAMGLPEPDAVQDLKAGTLESLPEWEKKNRPKRPSPPGACI